MFARKVAARLKPDSLPQFTNLVNSEILPWLRKQKGFLDLIILADTDSREIATISFWDQKRNAELYSSNGYPEVLKVLEKLLDHGPPYVKTFEVVSSTFQRNALAQADSENLIQETARRSSSSYETSL
jgi:hypothetical protein